MSARERIPYVWRVFPKPEDRFRKLGNTSLYAGRSAKNIYAGDGQSCDDHRPEIKQRRGFPANYRLLAYALPSKTGMQAPGEMEFSKHDWTPLLRPERSPSDLSSVPGSAYFDIASELGFVMLDFPEHPRRVMASAMFRTPIAITRLAMTCSKLRCRESSNRPYAMYRTDFLSGIAIGLNASGICFPTPGLCIFAPRLRVGRVRFGRARPGQSTFATSLTGRNLAPFVPFAQA